MQQIDAVFTTVYVANRKQQDHEMTLSNSQRVTDSLHSDTDPCVLYYYSHPLGLCNSKAECRLEVCVSEK